MAIIFIRTVILYFAILISMRLMGKRQLGELEISEFIVAALIADLAATPLQDIGIPLLNGLLPILIMFCLEVIIAGLNMKSIKLRKLTYGKPEIIIRNGRIDRGSMLRNRFTVDELMQELRAQGQNDASKISYGVLETNGQLRSDPHRVGAAGHSLNAGRSAGGNRLCPHNHKRRQDTGQKSRAARQGQTVARKRA